MERRAYGLGPESLVGLVTRYRSQDAMFREAFPECPGECPDGNLRLGGAIRPCHLLSRQCPFGQVLGRRAADRAAAATAAAGVPRRFLPLLGSPAPTRAVSVATNWSGRGFLTLLGNTGTGKSFAAALRVYLEALSGVDAVWSDPSRWEEVRPGAMWVSAYGAAASKDVLSAASGCRFLVLDDLGEESSDRRDRAALRELVSERYNGDQPTILTSNLTEDEIRDRYGDRTLERLLETGTLARCAGESLRLRD